MSEKNLPPSPQRLKKAREKGDVLKSADITSAATFIGALMVLGFTGPHLWAQLHSLWNQALQTIASSLTTASDASAATDRLLTQSAQTLALCVLPITATVLVCAVLSSFFQVGGLLAWQRINPDANRLNPAQGLQRLFSTRSSIDLIKALFKTLLLGSMLWSVIKAFLPQALRLGYASASQLAELTAQLLLQICIWAVVIYAVMAAVDYVHQRHEYLKQHRMSQEDVRQEHKEQQGDPLHHSLRKGLHHEILFNSLADRMQYASAVVHSHQVAVALYYAGPQNLPLIIARGENELATQIKRHATQLLVPTVFDSALAQRLYEDAALDQHIPRHLFKPVAKLMQWAMGD